MTSIPFTEQCIAITFADVRCTRFTNGDSAYCWQHSQIANNIKMDIMDDISNDMKDLKINDDNPAMIDDLEQLMSTYTTVDDYMTLIEYNPQKYNISRYLKNNDISILEAIDNNLLDVVKKLTSTKSNQYTTPVSGSIGDPAAVHCVRNGGVVDNVRLPDGRVVAVCMRAGKKCQTWAYLRGECDSTQTVSTLQPRDYVLVDYCCKKGRTEILQYFVELGLPVTETSLNITVAEGHLTTFQYLVYAFGLTKTEANHFFLFKRMFETAIKHNRLNIVKFIVTDIGLKIKNNIKTYLNMAKNNKEIYDWLSNVK